MAIGQVIDSSQAIDIHGISNYINISPKVSALISSKNTSVQEAAAQSFAPLKDVLKTRLIPVRFTTKSFFLHFTIYNSGNNADTICLRPGNLFDEISIYAKEQNKFELLNIESEPGYPEFVLAGGAVKDIYVKLLPSKTEFNYITPLLINKDFVDFYQKNGFSKKEDIKQSGLLVSGVMLTMCLFCLVNFLLNRRKEFLYYLLYALCTFLLVFFVTTLTNLSSTFCNIYFGYFDFALLLGGTIFYVMFTRLFLDTAKKISDAQQTFQV